jgi:alkyldihydroxyacetonephosphate synthase
VAGEACQAGVAERLAKAAPGLATSASGPDRIAYARDLWPRHHLEVSAGRIADHRPALVAWPRDAEEVAAVVRFCADEGVPLVPFGAGSGVCGGVLPDPRTIVLDLKRLDRWRKLDTDALSLEVEAGALGIRLEEDLEAKGFTTGHFPSSILCSTVGGWVAARGAGQCSGRYGKIEDMVASLECVLGTGEVARLERRVHGPDLTPLVIGSEGVLGVVTSVTLRLHPAPPARTFGAFSFPTLEAGWSAMRDMFQVGLRPAVARLYDPFDSFIARLGSVRRGLPGAPRSSAGVGGAKHAHEPHMPGAGGVAIRGILRAPRLLNDAIDALQNRAFGGATLVLIFEGPAGEGLEDMARAEEITRRHGASALGEGPARHWLEHRYGVSYRQSPVFMSGAFSDTMEVAAPWSLLDRLYRDVRAALGRHVFVMAHLSHAYPDGCSIYFTFAGSAATPNAALAKYDEAWRAALDAAIAAGGTLSHHHGVGRSKAPKLGAELGLGVDVVHAVRRALDPAGVLNPGNLLPREPPARRPPATAPATPVLDRASQLVHASGSALLASIEDALARDALSLGLAADGPPLADTTLAAWLARGAPGAPDPWLDPVDHLVAGFTARLASGAELEVRPSPRRAVGPDLFALFLGTGERAGTITSAHLRARGPVRARAAATQIERDAPLNELERAIVDRVLDAVRDVR